mgnify:CR=1 FL=1
MKENNKDRNQSIQEIMIDHRIQVTKKDSLVFQTLENISKTNNRKLNLKNLSLNHQICLKEYKILGINKVN